jgi:N-methylhydantoinase B
MSNSQNAPTEVIEMTYPLLVERYGLVPDSEGPGKFRGGFGMVRELTILEADITVRASTDRVMNGPYGLNGGEAGGRAQLLLEQPNGKKESLPPKSTFEAHPGDKIIIRTAGGGGWGSPLERAPEKVRDDVLSGLITLNRARDVYGVQLAPESLDVDQEATSNLRRKLIPHGSVVTHAP